MRTFHWVDYLVIALSLISSVVIGIFFAIRDWHNDSNENCLLGGRNMHPFPVAMSSLATFLSAVPAEIYYSGTMFSLIGVRYVLLFTIGNEILIPFFHKFHRMTYQTTI